MTLVANRDERDPNTVIVRTTYGPVTNEVREDIGHVRSFWVQLGRVLHAPEDGNQITVQHDVARKEVTITGGMTAQVIPLSVSEAIGIRDMLNHIFPGN